MPDRKKVLSWLEGLAQDDWQRWHSDSEVQEIAKAAFELLKEQEAKQVKLYEKEEWVGFSCACPDCKARWMGSKSETHFCPNCGRLVKWE